ncbi:MAG: hypothetical protein ACRD3W_29105, partial [Terriglobales bacterium]
MEIFLPYLHSKKCRLKPALDSRRFSWNAQMPPSDSLQTLSDAPISNSSPVDVLRNEALVFGDGITRSFGAAQEAAGKALHDPNTLIKVGTSIAIGFGLTYLAGRTGTIGLIGRGLGVAAGASFALDVVKPFYEAFDATLHAKNQSDLDRAGSLLGNSMGAFAVDTAIQMPGAILGGGLANSLVVGRAPSFRASLLSETAPAADVAQGAKLNLAGAATEQTSSKFGFLDRLKPSLPTQAELTMGSDFQAGKGMGGGNGTTGGAADSTVTSAQRQSEKVDATDKTTAAAESAKVLGYRA